MEWKKIPPKKGVYTVKIFSSFVDAKINAKSAVTIGKFDGLHLGHDFLIEKTVLMKEKGYQAVVVTFDRPPKRTIEGSLEKVLMTQSEKHAYLENIGVDVLLELTFDENLMRIGPEDFISRLVEAFCVKYMVTGSDFTYGYKGMGDTILLKKLANEMDFELEVVEKLQNGSQDISSTLIRKEIACGRIEHANILLGYPYFIIGEILHGNHIGSDRIGRPTINIHPPADKLLPPNGVYVSEVFLLGRRFHGVSNVGYRPSIEEVSKRIGIETHILDFDANVYDRVARVVFLKYLRPEQRFASMEELKTQIEKDVQKTYCYFNGRGQSDT